MSYRAGSQQQQQQQQQQKDIPGSSRMNTSLKPSANSNRVGDSSANNNSRTGSQFAQQQQPQTASNQQQQQRSSNKPSPSSVDPMQITPEHIWATRQKQQQSSQNADGTIDSPGKQKGSNNQENNNNNVQRKPSSSSRIVNADENILKSKPGSSPLSPNQKGVVDAAQVEALLKSQAAERAAQEKAFQLSKSSNTVLSEEVSNLREENAQLRDIEKQFWILLDEREQLQEELQKLQNGISNNNINNQNSKNRGDNNNNNTSSQYHNKYYGHVRVPQNQSEAEKNYTQMVVALDEALNMLVQLDRTAASRFSGSSQQSSSVVLPGSLIYRFLEFCSAERMNTLQVVGIGSSANGNNRNNFSGGAQTSDPLLNQMHQNIQDLVGGTTTKNGAASSSSRSGSNVLNNNNNQAATPGKVLDVASHLQQINQSMMSNKGSDIAGQGGFQSTIHASNLSQALRLAQDEIHHLKMELDRSDLSRLQALDDVDKMQKQIQVLSSSIVELRSAYASARAQADANARSAETVHDVTVRLAERDAEIAHLKARVAEMQRLAASGGSALAADTSRIRQELASRVANKY